MEVLVELNGKDKLIYFNEVERRELDNYATKPLKPILSDKYSLEGGFEYYLAVKNLKERSFLAVRK